MEKKTDRNSLIGFVLVGLILVYFFWQNSPKPVDPIDVPQTETEIVEAEVQEQGSEDLASAQIADSTAVDSITKSTAPLKTEFYTLENEFIRLVVSSKGGEPVEVRLKNFQTYDSLPLYLIKDGNSGLNIAINEQKQTRDMHFALESQSAEKLVLVSEGPEGKVRMQYNMRPKDYQIDLKIRGSKLSGLDSEKAALHWGLRSMRHEKNDEYERNNTTVYYHYAAKQKSDYLSETRDSQKEKENIDWIAFKQQFFSSILTTDRPFDKAFLETIGIEEDSNFTKIMTASVPLATDEDGFDLPLHFYFGPNKFKILKSYDKGFEKLIPLGWGIFGWINRGVIIPIFTWLESYGLNYGIIILLMTLIIKLVLFPLTYGSYRSMAKTRILKPEVDAINEKYKDKDPMKKQQEVMKLYQQAGVNPLGGCIPVLFQMPILFAIFRFFPASIELRQQQFLWADDLSTYDSILNLPFTIPFYGDHVSLFTLLMTVSTIIYTWMNQQMTGTNSQYPQLKYMMYLMPLIFLGVFNNFAAGLSYYYFVANVITFGQQFAIRSMIDDKKILAKIEINRQKPKKASRFQQKMDELAKEKGKQAPRLQKRKKK